MTTAEKLTEIFRNLLGDDDLELRDDLTAADVEAWDSLAHVNLMFAIEDAFGIRFGDSDFNGFADVGELRRYVEARVGS